MRRLEFKLNYPFSFFHSLKILAILYKREAFVLRFNVVLIEKVFRLREREKSF